MKLIEAREKLAKFNLPLVTLQDVIGLFQIEKAHASKLMSRLTHAGSLVKIRRGLWAWPNIEPLCIPTFLTAPLPSYISLQTALFYHGIIEQVPSYYYAVSLSRKQKTRTPFGTFSIHHIDVSFFFGYETNYNPFFQIATPEKALLDYLYLSKVEPKLFGKLPEIDKEKLNDAKLRNIIDNLTDGLIKTMLQKKVKVLLFSNN